MKTRRTRSFSRRNTKSRPFFNAPAIQLKERGDALVADTPAASMAKNGLPPALQNNMENLSGIDLSQVRVHHNSTDPARLNARAYTQGENIHLSSGEEQLLPHETWHVVQQKQGRVQPTMQTATQVAINDDPKLEAEADRMGAKAIQVQGSVSAGRSLAKPAVSNSGSQPVQRQVRINGGAKRVDEAAYQVGGAKSGVGSKYSVAALIGDGVKRVFTNESELEAYANGQTDFIGDVKTASAGTYWFRLPEIGLNVLGEYHHYAAGNAVDVIKGLNTSRFKY